MRGTGTGDLIRAPATASRLHAVEEDTDARWAAAGLRVSRRDDFRSIVARSRPVVLASAVVGLAVAALVLRYPGRAVSPSSADE
jgi:hypothetical protein